MNQLGGWHVPAGNGGGIPWGSSPPLENDYMGEAKVAEETPNLLSRGFDSLRPCQFLFRKGKLI